MYRVRIDISAGVVVMRLPDTASDALAFLAWIYPRLTDGEAEVDDMTEAIEHLCEWLGQHAVITPATDAMQRADAALWFDEALDIGEKVTVALTLCRKASVPQKVVDDLRNWMESATHKDCGCVRCADPEKYDAASEKTKAIIDEHCKRYVPSSQAINVASLSAAAKGSDLLG